MRFAVWAIAAMVALSGCEPEPGPVVLGDDGLPLPRLYRIDESDRSAVQFRMLDGLNALRAAAGAPQLVLDARLQAAAATHARDMSVQNRPWHFGSDGSSPIDRVARVGYPGRVVGEVISETYETEMQTLAAWMEQADTRGVLLDPAAVRMGFSWVQEPNGKIWWIIVLGA